MPNLPFCSSQMYTLEAPYRDMTAQQILGALMQGTIRLRIPSSCEPEWRQLIEVCMQRDPDARPSFKTLTARLDAMVIGLLKKQQP